jgi:hypothetical protein
MTSDETILGVLEGVSYQTFDTIYDLIFTTRRVIAVIIRDPLDISYNKPGFQQIFFGELFTKRKEQLERNRIAEERHRATREKALDELGAIHPRNFEIRYDAIISVEVTRRLLRQSLIFHLSTSSQLERKICFSLPKEKVPDTLTIMKLVLSAKVKHK